jgi:hypothetical protein
MENAQPLTATTGIGTAVQNRFPPHLVDGDGTPSTCTANPNPARLYELLDALVALRLEFADGAEGEKAISWLGRTKVMEVRTVLDTAIVGMKRVVNEVEPLVTVASPLI